MNAKSRWHVFAIVIVLLAIAGTASTEPRTWTDTTGKFKVNAELVEIKGDKAVLRREDGKQISVPLERLSEADRAFIKSGKAGGPETDAADAVIADIATRFYSDLRSKERDHAGHCLTKKAEALMTAGQSPLAGLPEPESDDKAIRPGKVKLDGDIAEIPVVVRAGGRQHKTKLHLRKEGDDWCVFALSAIYPDGEKSINFEAAQAAQQNVDPLQAILGKSIELEGYTIDGAPLSLSQYEGKIVLVDFWATWCGPCVAEIPNIRENWDKHHNDGFEVVAISVDEDMNALAAFVAQEKPPWAVVADNHPRNKKSMGGKFGIRAIPAFILLGRDGKVAAVNCRGQRLGQQVTQLIASK